MRARDALGAGAAAGGEERERFFRRHRASVQRWLGWLHDAGLIRAESECDNKGYWWRTVIELRGRPLVDVEALQAAQTRIKGWAMRAARSGVSAVAGFGAVARLSAGD